MTTDVIIGFLSGSLTTGIVREIFSFIVPGHELKKKLHKLTNERKLQTSEKAIAYYHTCYDRIVKLKKTYEVYIKVLDEIIFDTDAIEKVIDKSAKLLTELNHNKYLDVNSINLYFGLETDGWSEQDAAELAKAMVDAAKEEEKIKYWLAMGYKRNNTDEQMTGYCLMAYDLVPGLIELLQKVVELLDKNQESMKKAIKSIKEQMKRY